MHAAFAIGCALGHVITAMSVEELRPVVEQVIAEELSSRPLAGLSVAIGDGRETWVAGYGLMDVASKRPVTPDTEFRLASVTKTMTAVSTLMLQEQGVLNVDDDIRRCVPSFSKKQWPVTVRHLLGHLGGVSSYRNCRVECHDKAPKTTNESLAVFSNWRLEAEPGRRYIYTTYGFNLLGACIEKKSGLGYDVFLRKKLGERAQFTVTRVDKGPRSSQRASGYRVKDGALVPSELIDVTGRFAGGGTVSTAHDVLRFGRALVDGKLISKNTLRDMSQSMSTSDGRLTKYGMGVATYPLAGRRVIGHAGGQPETSSLLLMYPGHDLVIALITNTEDQWSALYRVAGRVAELYFHDGERRRGIVGTTRGEHAFLDVLQRSFSHGVAEFEVGATDVGAAESRVMDLIDARDRVVSMLTTALADDAPRALADDVDLGLGPSDGAPITTYGAFAASMIASKEGRAALEKFHADGALAFFIAFDDVCRRTDCPSAFRLPALVIERIRALHADHRAAYSDELRATTVGPHTDLDALFHSLQNAFAHKRAIPDFGDELLDEADRATAALDDGRAKVAQDIAHALYPHHGKVVLTLSERALALGEIETARALIEKALVLPGVRERLAPERTLVKARAVEKSAGGSAAAALMLDAAISHFSDRAELFDARADVARRQNDMVAEREALTAAQALAPTATRSRRIKSLQTR